MLEMDGSFDKLEEVRRPLSIWAAAFHFDRSTVQCPTAAQCWIGIAPAGSKGRGTLETSHCYLAGTARLSSSCSISS